MKKVFFSNIAFLTLLNIAVKPIWVLGIDRTAQNVLGWEEYGLYYAVFSFSFLFHIILDLGITYFNNKTIAQDRQLLSKYLPYMLSSKLVLAVAYFALCFIGALLIGYGLQSLHILKYLLINQILVSFIVYFRSNLSALHLFKLDSSLSVLDKSLMIIFCAVILWTDWLPFEFSLMLFILAQTLAYLITMLIALLILRRHTQISIKWDVVYATHIFKNAWPFALAVLLMTIYNKIDTVMLERMLSDGPHQAGIYASAYRLLESLVQLGILFSVLLLPIYAKMIKAKESVAELARFSYKLLFSFGAAAGVNAAFYAPEIMDLLYTQHSEAANDVFILLMLSYMAICGFYIFSTLLTAGDKLGYINKLAFGGVVLNVLLNWYLIPEYQVMGAAVATIITQFLLFVGYYYGCVRHFKRILLPADWLGMAMLLIFMWAYNNYFPSLFDSWMKDMAFVMFLSLLFALLIKLIDLKEIRRLYLNGDES